MNILRFWNILEKLFRHDNQKKRYPSDLGCPPGQLGGCFGGALPWAPPSSDRSRFFCLSCLNNYSKIFQKRRIFKLLLEGPQVEHPLGGAPLRPLGPPQWPPGVPEIWKKLQKFPKIILKFYMYQNIPNYNSNIQFGPLG